MMGKYWAVPNNISCTEIPPLEPEGKEDANRFSLNEAFFYLVGRWLGDGWLRDSQRSGRPEGQNWGIVVICESADKADKLVTAARQVTQNIGIEDTRTCVKIKIYSKPLTRWLRTHFGKYASGKTLPGWVYGMPETLRRALFTGLLDADGYRMNASVYRLTTISKKLAHSVRLLAETLGYSTTVYFDKRPAQTVIEGRTVNQHDTYMVEMRIPAHKKGIRTEKHTWYPVRTVCPTGELKRVYNLTVENDNSYVADGVVVHNCQDLSVAGKQAGIHEGKRSSLFFEAIRIIREMRYATHGRYPRYAVFENVPGIFSTSRGEDLRAVLQAFVSLCDDSAVVPGPPKGKWLHAGEILGDHYSVAWRI